MLRKPQQWISVSFGLGCLVAFGAVATTLFSTCSSSDGGGGGGGRGGSADASALTGAWATVCIADPGKPGYWFKDTRSFDGDQFTAIFETFSDEACQDLVMTQSQNGAFALGEVESATPETATETEEGEEVGTDGVARPLDLTLSMIYVTLHQQGLVDAYNQRAFCGGGWELGVAHEMTRAVCAAGSTTGEDTKPDIVYDLVMTKNGALYFGTKDKAHDGRTEAARPAVVDQGRAYEAQ
jgi:hypothetical protein